MQAHGIVVRVGDMVQALEQIDDSTGPIADRGAIGYVMAVDGEWYTVTFERDGATSDCHTSELLWLCDSVGDPTVHVAAPASPSA